MILHTFILNSLATALNQISNLNLIKIIQKFNYYFKYYY